MQPPVHSVSDLDEGGYPLSLVSAAVRFGRLTNGLADHLQPHTSTSSSGLLTLAENKRLPVLHDPVKTPCQQYDQHKSPKADQMSLICENCDGVGEFVDQHITGNDPRDGSPLGWEEEYPCPVCGGSGRVPEEYC